MKTIRTLTGLLFISHLLFTTGCGFHFFGRKRALDHYVTAISLRAAAFNEDAILELQETVRFDQDFTLAYSMLGDLYRQQGQYEQAAGAYENACRLDPWGFNDHLHLGQVYRTLERFVDGIRILKRACLLKPDSAPANYSLAVCYYETEDYEQAVTFCTRAAELDPNNTEIFTSLGDIRGKLGDDYKAINAYKQALEVNGNQSDVMIRLGMVYARMKRFDPARLILDRAVQTAPDDPDTHLALGYCLLKQKDLQAALDAYLSARRLDETNYKAHNGLGVTYMLLYIDNPQDHKMAQDALNAWHRSLELNPNQAKIKAWVDKYTQQLYPSSTESAATRPSASKPLYHVGQPLEK